MRKILLTRIIAGGLAIHAAALAAPPSPPNEDAEKAIAAASCESSTHLVFGQSVSLKSEPVPAEFLGGSHGMVGKLSYLWGLKLSSSDERLGGITSLALDDLFGLVAVTDHGNWITFDLEKGRLDDLRSVNIAPMLGLAGAPSAVLPGGGFPSSSFLVSVPADRSINRYAAGVCGWDAKAVRIATTDIPVIAIATVAYSDTLFAGNAPGTSETADVVQNFFFMNSSRIVSLNEHNIPDLAGYSLVSLSGPADRSIRLDFSLASVERQTWNGCSRL